MKLKEIYNGRRFFKPKNEFGIVFVFSRHHKELGFEKIVEIRSEYPDCVALKDNETVTIEFEFLSSSYTKHRHHRQPQNCDFLVCWKDDANGRVPDVRRVIELREKDIREVNLRGGIEGEVSNQDIYEKMVCLEDMISFHTDFMKRTLKLLAKFTKEVDKAGFISGYFDKDLDEFLDDIN